MPVPFLFGYDAGDIMQRKLTGRSSTPVLVALAMIALMGLGLSAADAQTSSQSPLARPATHVTIGPVRVSNRPASSTGSAQHSP